MSKPLLDFRRLRKRGNRNACQSIANLKLFCLIVIHVSRLATVPAPGRRVLFFIAGRWAGEVKPSFLDIAIDDLNGYVGSLGGHPNTSTPHLDRLAKAGVLFNNAHCVSPVCNPSRTAVWTGLRPTTTGIPSNPSGWFREARSPSPRCGGAGSLDA